MHEGKKLEERVKSVFKDLNCLPNVFALRLNPEYKIRAKVYTSAQPADYMIRVGNTDIFFDTKACREPVWYLSHARPNQVSGMEKLARLNCVCGFLIWFYAYDFNNLRWFSTQYGHFAKKAAWQDLPIWDWQMVIGERKAQ